jgi:hypothetical protein
MLASGEAALRSYLAPDAPLKLTLIFGHEFRRWEVLAQYHPEGHAAPMLLGRETLDEFPTPTLIAQAMLLS